MSVATPSRRRRGNDALRFGLRTFAKRDDCDLRFFGLRRIDHHCEPLDPRSPSDGWCLGSAKGFDEPIIAAARKHRALGAQSIGNEFERGVAIIIESAYQPWRALPCNARSIEARRHLAEKVGGFAGEKFIDGRGAVHDRPVLMGLAVENAQRIALQARLAVVAQRMGCARKCS